MGLLRAALGIASSVFGAFVFSKLWAWFVASKFGLPTVGVAEGWGLMMVIAFPHVAKWSHDAVEKTAHGQALTEAQLSIARSVGTACAYAIAIGLAYVLTVVR
jgi:hypothetical protein